MSARCDSIAPVLAGLAAVLGALLAPACGDTVYVGGDDDVTPRSAPAELDAAGVPTYPTPLAGPDAGPFPTSPPDAGLVPPPTPPPSVASSSHALSACGDSGGATGGTSSGGACGLSTSVQCLGDGRGVRALITPLDCASNGRVTGDPAQLQTDCLTALDGKSGQGCAGTFLCARPTHSACCLQVASCQIGASLGRYEVCPEVCPAPNRVSSQLFIGRCEDLSALWAKDPSLGAWLGARCEGAFVCTAAGALRSPNGGATPAYNIYYCGNGALQMVPFFTPSATKSQRIPL